MVIDYVQTNVQPRWLESKSIYRSIEKKVSTPIPITTPSLNIEASPPSTIYPKTKTAVLRQKEGMYIIDHRYRQYMKKEKEVHNNSRTYSSGNPAFKLSYWLSG